MEVRALFYAKEGFETKWRRNVEEQKQEREMEIGILKAEMSELALELEEEREQWRRACYENSELKTALEEAKKAALGIIIDLKRESSKLKQAVASLTNWSKFERARNEELVCDLNEVLMERNNALESLSNEKESVEKLTLLLMNKEKRIAQVMEEARRAKAAATRAEAEQKRNFFTMATAAVATTVISIGVSVLYARRGC